MTPSVAIVIPALNEAKTIGEVVAVASAFGDVIVVDDGSTDGTRDMAEMAGACVINHSSPRGYDLALASGFRYAVERDYSIMITIDADGQLPADLIPVFISKFSKEVDIVVGHRPSFPRYTEYLFALFCHSLTEVHDPFCGMKAYRLSACSMFDEFDRYRSVGTDLMLRIVLMGGRADNVPIIIRPRDGSPRFGSRLRSELMLLRAIWIGLIQIFREKFIRRIVKPRMERRNL
jgi:glycosyltransferase involved in cell wall biosynthesis